jgi:hypothetical protein
MLEDFFLTYANNSFRENPDNLYKILDEINSSLHSMYELTEYARKFLFETIISLSKIYNPGKAMKYIKEMVSETGKRGFDWGNLSEVAYYAVYGFKLLEERCGEKLCYLNFITMHSVLKQSGLNTDIQLKCNECNQLQFIVVLSSIARGEYEKLNKFYRELLDNRINSKETNWTYHHHNAQYLRMYLFPRAYDCFRPKLEVSDNGDLSKSYILADVNLIGSHYPVESRFNSYLNSLLGFSLSEFIINNDLRKLKRCEECKHFYVSKTIRSSKFCSDKCRLDFHNRKRTESGEAREYKRRKREKGAKESYYG